MRNKKFPATLIININILQNFAFMVISVYLEEEICMREELKFAVMECGELFTLEAGTAVMLQLFADN